MFSLCKLQIVLHMFLHCRTQVAYMLQARVSAEREREALEASLRKLRRASHLWRLDYQKEVHKRFSRLVAEVYHLLSVFFIYLCVFVYFIYLSTVFIYLSVYVVCL